MKQTSRRDAPERGVVFRGTTEGFPGGGSGVTFTSSDPGVATVFALQKRTMGTPVIEITRTSDLAAVPRLPSTSPTLATIEAEIIFDIQPAAFSRMASQVSLDDAVRALRDIGVTLPRHVGIGDISQVLREVPKLTQEQIHFFLQKVGY